MPRLTAPRRQAEVCAPLPAAHAAARYARHLPERTLLYALVQAHYPDFIVRLEAEDRPLPEYVREEFETSLGVKSGEKVGKRACSPTVGLGQHGAKGIQATSEEAFGRVAVPEAA